MYIIHMKFKEATKHGWHSYARENESFSKILQIAEEMRDEYKDVPVEAIDILNSKAGMTSPGCFEGLIIASLRVIK